VAGPAAHAHCISTSASPSEEGWCILCGMDLTGELELVPQAIFDRNEEVDSTAMLRWQPLQVCSRIRSSLPCNGCNTNTELLLKLYPPHLLSTQSQHNARHMELCLQTMPGCCTSGLTPATDDGRLLISINSRCPLPGVCASIWAVSHARKDAAT
jgi:hypothetical protein